MGSTEGETWRVEYAQRAAYLPEADALVLADLHVGRDRTSNVEAPLGERDRLLDALGAPLARFDPGTVVVAGDLLHAFESVPDGVEATVTDLADRVEEAGADLVVTPGNHDAMLDGLLACPTPGAIELADGTVVCHGHEVPDREADRYVVGHEHPALDVEGRRFPCFLRGDGGVGGAETLVLPAFTPLAAGTAVNGRRGDDAFSPVVESLDCLRPVVIAHGEVHEFPRLDALRSVL